MDKTVTQWFKGAELPAREGVYQRNYSGEVQFCLYANLFWRKPSDTAAGARRSTRMSAWQELPWRGLAEQKA